MYRYPDPRLAMYGMPAYLPPAYSAQRWYIPPPQTRRVVSGDDVDAMLAMAGANDMDPTVMGLDLAAVSGAEIVSGAEFDFSGAEIVSGDDFDFSGDDEEFSGADPRRPRRRPRRIGGLSGLARQVRMAKALANQPTIQMGRYTKVRTLPLPVNSNGTIAAGATVTISVTPNAPYKLEYIVIPVDIAALFNITSLSIGRENGFAGAGSISGLSFADTVAAEFNKFDLPATPPGIPIQIGVQNVSLAAATFSAKLQGKIVEG